MNRVSITCIAAAIFLTGPTTAGGQNPVQRPEGPHCRLGASGLLDGYCAIFYGREQCAFLYDPTDCPVGKHVKTMQSIYCVYYDHGYVPIAPRRPCKGAH